MGTPIGLQMHILDCAFSVTVVMTTQLMNFKFPLSFLIWNVRGLGNQQKCSMVKDVALDLKPDIICYQETKLRSCTPFQLRQVCPPRFVDFITLDSDGTRGGILLAWSNKFTRISTMVRSFSVSAVLRTGELTILCTGVYGPQDDRTKLVFLDELRNIAHNNEWPWVIMGDFNLFRSLDDTSAVVRNLGTLQAFNQLIHETGVVEVPLAGRTFTWSSKRPNPTFSKLDRAFLSDHWIQLGATYTLQDLTATVSDHAPLALTVKPHTNPSRRSFRFELFWLRYQEVKLEVQQA